MPFERPIADAEAERIFPAKETSNMSIFQMTSTITLLIFYTCYFAKKLSQKRKGIQTTQIGKGKTGLSRTVEIVMGIATASVLIAEIISMALNCSAVPIWLRIAGIIAGAVGDIFFITAVLTMRDSWRAGVSNDKTELVTEGIFQISRNPAFLGFDLVYMGILLQFFNWLLCGFTLFAILMLHLQIVNNEEEAMLRAFGEGYLDYKKRVNRYLGRKRVRCNLQK